MFRLAVEGDARVKEFFTGRGAKAEGWSVESASLDKIQLTVLWRKYMWKCEQPLRC